MPYIYILSCTVRVMLSQVEDKVQADQYSDSFSDTDYYDTVIVILVMDTDSDTGDRLILIMIVIGC